MSKTDCKCAPPVADLGEAIRASRGIETNEKRVARLTDAFKVGVSPISEAPRVAAAVATAPSPDWAEAIRAARQ